MVRTRTIVVIALIAVGAAVAFGIGRYQALTGGAAFVKAGAPIAGLATGRPTMYEFSTTT